MTRELLWYYTERDVPQGPVPWRRIEDLAASHTISATDVVRREDQTDWVTVIEARQHQLHSSISPEGLATLAEEDPMADYDRPPQKKALKLWTMIVLFAVLAVPTAVRTTTPGSQDQLMKPTEILLGFGLLLLPLLYHMYQRIRDWRVGSSWDRANRTIAWWNGPATSPRQLIRIDDISSMHIVEDHDLGTVVSLFDRNGNKIPFDTISLRDAKTWAAALVARYPHIAFEGDISNRVSEPSD